jgi:ABC-type nitrate/sulfonate/bicarbonate transport system substrate-binding protein
MGQGILSNGVAARKEGNSWFLTTCQGNPGSGPHLLVVRKEFAGDYPNTTKTFVKRYFKAVDLLEGKPEECAKVLVQRTYSSLRLIRRLHSA